MKNQINLGDPAEGFNDSMKVVFYLIIVCIIVVIAVGVWEAAT